MTITEFLLARIAEDRESATQAEWAMQGEWFTTADDQVDAFVQRESPARVLAECAAKRAIIDDHAATDHSYREDVYVGDDVYLTPSLPACRQCTTSTDTARITSSWDVADRIIAPCDTVRALAAVYADHPDYDPSWRV